MPEPTIDRLDPYVAEHAPQRFRWLDRGYVRWKYGCCVHLPVFNQWMISVFGLTGVKDRVTFDKCPWEVMGKVVRDCEKFEWIDNDLNWHAK